MNHKGIGERLYFLSERIQDRPGWGIGLDQAALWGIISLFVV